MNETQILPNGTALTTGVTPWEHVAYRWKQTLARKSDRTRTEYQRYMRHFLESIGNDPAAATPGNVHDFAYRIGASGKEPSPSTITVRLAAVRSFYDIARRSHLVPENPTDDVDRPRAREATPKGLEAAQIMALLRVTPQTPAGARDRAAIVTFVLTGLRRRELLGMRRRDLEEQAGRVYYGTVTKGGHQRRRELPAPAYQAIREALEALGTPFETLDPDAPLFPGRNGEPLREISFYDNLRRYATQAGLAGVTPHVLRHSAAKLRRDSGASIEDVSALLGHRSLHTTSRYLARLEGEQDTGWYGTAAALGLDMTGGKERHADTSQ